ncbi:MAG: sulfatase-like hydrolase/transferase [bacterium]|nr:sulfatase-like hydrolase/transferase [bacterium]
MTNDHASLTRRELLAASIAAGTAPLISRGANAASKKPNVLLLISDDQGLDTPSYGNPVIQTPHLEQLAADGVRFTNAFCTTPSCSASRSVIFTGLQNHRNGQYGHAHDYHHFAMHEFVEPLPRLLKRNGYSTGLIGKFHVNPAEAFAFDYLPPGREYGGSRNVTGMAKAARKFFDDNQDSPFFLSVGFSDPHRAGEGFGNEDNKSDIEPVTYPPDEVIVPPFLPDRPEVRQELAEYYQAVSRMDQGVGLILKALEKSGLADNTLVIYISDNGIPFPGAKTCLYDPGVRLPMLVRAPGQTRRGVVNNAMVSFADITPSILQFTGTPAPEYGLDGRSFMPILEEENPEGWDDVFFSHTFHEITMYYPSRGIRTRRYKYLRNLAHPLPFPFASDLWASKTWQAVLKSGDDMYGPRPLRDYMHRAPEELYDLENDPDEVHNLAGDRRYADVLRLLRGRTLAFQRRTDDPWLILENYFDPTG